MKTVPMETIDDEEDSYAGLSTLISRADDNSSSDGTSVNYQLEFDTAGMPPLQPWTDDDNSSSGENSISYQFEFDTEAEMAIMNNVRALNALSTDAKTDFLKIIDPVVEVVVNVVSEI